MGRLAKLVAKLPSEDVRLNQLDNDLLTALRGFFPDVPYRVYLNFTINKVGLYSMTTRYKSNLMLAWIQENLDGGNLSQLVLADGTAGVGGDTMNYCREFSKVFAIEQNTRQFHILASNVAALGVDNITVLRGNSVEVISNLLKDGKTVDVAMFDPPWGGLDYKKEDKVPLSLGGLDIGEVCDRLFYRGVKYVVLKVPANFALEDFMKNKRLAVTTKSFGNFLGLFVRSAV